jgi:CRP-like cAMP-binding protein
MAEALLLGSIGSIEDSSEDTLRESLRNEYASSLQFLAEYLAKKNVCQHDIIDAGHILMSVGDPGDSLYFVVRGELTVHHTLDSSPIAVLSAGNVFGEAAIVTGEPRNACVVVSKNEPAEVLRLTAQKYDDIKTTISKSSRDMAKRVEDALRTGRFYKCLRGCEIFRGIGSENLTWLATKVSRQVLPSSDLIAKAGDINGDLYVISAGEAEKFAAASNGNHDPNKTQQLAVMRPGDFCGEEALLSNTVENWKCSVFSGETGPVEVLKLNGSDLQKLSKKCPSLVKDAKQICESLSESGGQINFSIYVAYCSETGTAEGVAEVLYSKLLSAISAARLNVPVKLMALDDVVPEQSDEKTGILYLPHSLIFIVASTFGVGEAPGNATKYFTWLQDLKSHSQEGAEVLASQFAVLGIGSRACANTFCKFAFECDKLLGELGASRLLQMSILPTNWTAAR